MKSIFAHTFLLGAIFAFFLPRATYGQPASDAGNHPALKDAVILIIRHAEKPDAGTKLSPAGEKRANAYVDYFKSFKVDDVLLKPDYLVSTADSKSSERPRLTLEPLGKALNLTLDSRFKNKNYADLVREIQSKPHGRHILICWHHGEIPNLVEALGGNPAALLPGGKWPAEEFGWVLLLRFDHEGRLMPDQCRRVHEKLMPGDD